MTTQNNILKADATEKPELGDGRPSTPCYESSSLDEILVGNALFFLLDLRPLYAFVNASESPRDVRACLQRINLAASSIELALGKDGYARAKARDQKMKADLAKFISHNIKATHPRHNV